MRYSRRIRNIFFYVNKNQTKRHTVRTGFYYFFIVIYVRGIYVYRDAIRINICMPLREMDICKIRKTSTIRDVML